LSLDFASFKREYEKNQIKNIKELTFFDFVTEHFDLPRLHLPDFITPRAEIGEAK